jgi:hypothetical protein
VGLGVGGGVGHEGTAQVPKTAFEAGPSNGWQYPCTVKLPIFVGSFTA